MVTPVDRLNDTIDQLRRGTLALNHKNASRELRVTGAVAVDLIRAATMALQPGETVMWAGTATTTLELADSEFLNLELVGVIGGDVIVRSPVSGSLTVAGEVTGGIVVNQPIASGLTLGGTVHGRVALNAPVSSVTFKPTAHLGRDVFIYGPETLDSIQLQAGARIAGHLRVDKEAASRYVTIAGEIEGSASFNGAIEDSLTFTSTSSVGQVVVTGGVGRPGQTDSGVRFSATDTETVELRTDSGVRFNGTIAQTVELHAEGGGKIQVASFHGARFDSAVQLGDGVTLKYCEFRNFGDFDKLQLLGSELFPRGAHGRQVISADAHAPALSHAELATTYRRLRRGLEQQGNRPAASDFYYGESEARRHDAKQHLRTRWSEYAVLTLYKKVSGYGTRALYAIGWFIAIAGVASVLFAVAGVDLTDTHDVQQTSLWSVWPLADYGQLLLFNIRSMVSFFSPPQANLTAWEQTLQLVLRFVGPLLIAQAIIAVRERVAR